MQALRQQTDALPELKAGDVGLLIRDYGEKMFQKLPMQSKETGGAYTKDVFLGNLFLHPVRSMFDGLKAEGKSVGSPEWKAVTSKVLDITAGAKGKTLASVHRDLVDAALEHAGSITRKTRNKSFATMYNPDGTVAYRYLAVPEVEALGRILHADYSALRVPEVMADVLPMFAGDPRTVGFEHYIQEELAYTPPALDKAIGSMALQDVMPQGLW